MPTNNAIRCRGYDQANSVMEYFKVNYLLILRNLNR